MRPERDLVINRLHQLIFTGKPLLTDDAEEEGHRADGKVTESCGRFEENTNESDAKKMCSRVPSNAAGETCLGGYCRVCSAA